MKTVSITRAPRPEELSATLKMAYDSIKGNKDVSLEDAQAAFLNSPELAVTEKVQSAEDQVGKLAARKATVEGAIASLTAHIAELDGLAAKAKAGEPVHLLKDVNLDVPGMRITFTRAKKAGEASTEEPTTEPTVDPSTAGATA